MPDTPSLPYRDPRDDLPERRGNAASFAVGFAFGAAIVAAGVLLRSRRRRWMLAGFLLGIGVTSLVEGLCFYNG
jgi:hypothetical protein